MKTSVLLKISGMSCDNCVKHVKRELSSLNLFADDVQIGKASVQFDDAVVSRTDVEAAVHRAGYEVVSWDPAPEAAIGG